MLARQIYQTLTPTATTRAARLFRFVHHVLAAAGVVAMISGTVAGIYASFGTYLDLIFDATLIFFMAEYAIRFIVAPEAPWAEAGRPWHARWHWMRSGSGIVDLVALLPLVGFLPGAPVGSVRLAGATWILKFAPYSEGLTLVGRVLRNARGPIESLFLAFLVVLLLAATLAYLAERQAQPDAFSSIPAALWWAVVTLTTTGYGDVVPLTPIGRLIGGTVMICGISVFAFLAGILANSFAEEMQRRQFLRTWDLVAHVPFFREVGAPVIAEVARLLKARDVPAGQAITRRGEPGDCMYFIASGEVQIQIEPKALVLGPGQFFGEIALITGAPRMATAVAARPCQLLVLDIADFRRLAAQQPALMHAIDEEANRRLGRAPARPAQASD